MFLDYSNTWAMCQNCKKYFCELRTLVISLCCILLKTVRLYTTVRLIFTKTTLNKAYKNAKYLKSIPHYQLMVNNSSKWLSGLNNWIPSGWCCFCCYCCCSSLLWLLWFIYKRLLIIVFNFEKSLIYVLEVLGSLVRHKHSCHKELS